jgi:hypothetical protein
MHGLMPPFHQKGDFSSRWVPMRMERSTCFEAVVRERHVLGVEEAAAPAGLRLDHR